MKLLILIMGSHENKYPLIDDEGVYKSWGSLKLRNIEIYTYYGEYFQQEIINHQIHLLRNDKDCTGKTIEAFEFCFKRMDFDYILRTTVSTFVRPDLLYQKLLEKPRINYFSGYIVGGNKETQFISGNAMIFSKDLIKKIIEDKTSLFERNKIVDDVILSNYLINEKKIYPQDHFERFSAERDLNFLKNISKEKLNNYIFFRCKSSNGNREEDIAKLIYLYNLFYL